MPNISNVHDNFVRKLLADKLLAIDYFKSALPEHVARKLDFSTISQLSGSYVSGELEKTISDVVYRCRRSDHHETVDISLLVEHKSSPDKYTPIQVGSYLFSGYQQQIKQGHKRLSPIIPILFYHGRQKWEYWTLERLFADLDSDLLGFLPKFDYIYANLRDTPDEVIKAVDNQFLVSSLLMLKHAFEKLWLSRHFKSELARGLVYGSGVLQQAFMLYYFDRVRISSGQLMEIVNDLPLTIRKSVMNTYEMIIEKGVEKGAKQKSYEFVVKLLDAGKFTIAEIANYATVSEEFVKKIRAELKK